MQPALMQATSRESLVTLRVKLDRLVDGLDVRASDQLSHDLFAVASLLNNEIGLRRTLGDAASSASGRAELLKRLLAGKVGDNVVDVSAFAASVSWSVPGDLVDALIETARQSALAGAEKDQAIDRVEDELFRFGRILEAHGDLEQALGEADVPIDKRVKLLSDLLGDKVHPVTSRLVTSAVSMPRGQSVFGGVENLVALAAKRRARSVAVVTSPVALTPEQEQRLTASLARIYGRQIAISVDVDRSVLGGVRVQVGDDLIDGTVVDRLSDAQRRFAG